MNRKFTALLCFTIAFCTLNFMAYAQDDSISRNEVYPVKMFKDKGGRILDVTKLTTYGLGFMQNADKADNATDDGQAIIDALNWVANRRRSQLGGTPTESDCVYDESWIIYFPNGVYNVSQSIGYTGTPVKDCNNIASTMYVKREGIAGLKLIGQSREGVTIKLANGSAGFNSPTPKPVVLFSAPISTLNNAPAGFQFRNFTINCGNNTGAVGLDYYGANNSRLDNVLIIGASNNTEAGLDIHVATAHGYYSNITITGFKYGIRLLAGNGSSCPTLEYVSLSGQSASAVWVKGSAVTLRKIQSTNACTGLTMDSLIVPGPPGSEYINPSVVLIDSYLRTAGGASAATGIVISKGVLFARNIIFGPYASKITKNGVVQTGLAMNPVDEYRSDGFFNFSGDGATRVRSTNVKSMNLAVREVPALVWDTTKWQVVTGGADTITATNGPSYDDSAAIASAMVTALANGKNTVYFPKNFYKVLHQVTIPSGIESLIGLDTHIISPAGIAGDSSSTYAFTVSVGSSTMLVLNGFSFSGDGLTQSAKRIVYFEFCRSKANLYRYTNKTSPPNIVYANCVNRFGVKPWALENVEAYGRFINNEKQENTGQFNANGVSSSLWILGCKAEPTVNMLHATGGAKLEVLGSLGIRNGNGLTTGNPVILNEGANVSVTFAAHSTGGTTKYWTPVVKDIQGGVTYTVDTTVLVYRGYDHNIILPLYASYDPAVVPAPAPSRLLEAEPNVSLQNMLTVYPNPAKQNLSVSFTAQRDGKAVFTLVNSLSKTQITQNINCVQGRNNVQLNTSNLSAGLYLLTILKDGEQTVSKVIIAR